MADLTSEPEVEVLSSADGVRRRCWSGADKLRILEESLVGHRQVSATARRHGISRSLLRVWRRQHRNGELGGTHSPGFIPLMVCAGRSAAASTVPLRSNPEARVEIALGNGRRLVVPANVDPEALARLLPVVDSQ